MVCANVQWPILRSGKVQDHSVPVTGEENKLQKPLWLSKHCVEEKA